MFTVNDQSWNHLVAYHSAVDSARDNHHVWYAYGGIQAMGFSHLQVNQTYNFVDPQTGAHTQNIEDSWKEIC